MFINRFKDYLLNKYQHFDIYGESYLFTVVEKYLV